MYMLRCFQCGIRMADLEALSIGMVFDIFTESDNDNFDYKPLANQSDFDKF